MSLQPVRKDQTDSRSPGSQPSDSSASASDVARRQSSSAASARSASGFRMPSLTSAPDRSPASKAPKVAIPRLPHQGEPAAGASSKSGSRHRVMHACESCRSRKTKCSGEKPSCKHCLDFNATCSYADGKRDRAKKAFGSLNEKVADYEAMLRDLIIRVGTEDANSIKLLLEKGLNTGDTDFVDGGDSSQWQDFDSASGAESDGHASAGSTGAVDRTEEDFNKSEGSRGTGFIGKNSQVTWLQKLKREQLSGTPVGADMSQQSTNISKEIPVRSVSYHLDDFPVLPDQDVDPYEFPDRDHADLLFQSYLESVHASFPIIGKTTFTAQYKKFADGSASSPGERWLAILNMTFAIGAKYSHLVQAKWRGKHNDHLVYFFRARMLGLNAGTLFDHPDLQQVQVLGLIVFYLFASNQINRAWMLGGTAVRAALSLGLNMRNESDQIPNTSKEIRYRVWWSIYALEHQLCLVTGRPASVVNRTCTVPLPIPLDEDHFQTPQGLQMLNVDAQKGVRYPCLRMKTTNESNSSATPSSDRDRSRSGSKPTSAPRSPASSQQTVDSEWAKGAPLSASSYFLHYIQLTHISQSVLETIYNPEAMLGTWSDIQSAIDQSNELTSTWHRNLPGAFDFKRKQRDQSFVQYRMSLGFFYYGTRIVANRPCLCRMDRRIPNQSNKSREFNHNAVVHCIDAARDMLHMLPDEPNGVGLNRIGPWWKVLHSLVQATVVLLLELAFRAEHMPEDAEAIFDAARKGVGWLNSLAAESYSARRAWSMCNEMFVKSARRVGREITNPSEQASDPLTQPPRGTSYPNYVDEHGAAPAAGPEFQQLGSDLRSTVPIFTAYDEWASASVGEVAASLHATSSNMDLTAGASDNFEF